MMNIFVILAALQICYGYQWNTHLGPVQDTPEVAHAKAEHLAAVANAKAQSNAYDRSWAPQNSWNLPNYAPEVKYHGPIALPPGYDKYGAPLPVQDTPEVAHVKADRIASIAKAGGDIYPSSGTEPWSEDEGKWSSAEDKWTRSDVPQHYAAANSYKGPIAYSPGYDKNGAPLPVLETPEVSHTKALHFAAHAKAAASNSLGGHRWRRSLYEAAVSHQGYAPSVQYHGPIALPTGYDKNGAPLPVQDTPEVAHAKSVQLSLIAKAGGDIYPSVHHSGIESSSYEGSSWSAPQTQQYSGAEHIRYHGPIAHSPGYDKYGAPLPVLETPEVAHTKAEHFQNYAKTLSSLIAKGLYEPDYTAQNELNPSSYEGSSWSVPQNHYQYAANHIRYNGPIAHSPGYDKYGAPLPVVETPEVAHLKAEHSHNYAKTLSNLIAKGLYEPDYIAQNEHHHSW